MNKIDFPIDANTLFENENKKISLVDNKTKYKKWRERNMFSITFHHISRNLAFWWSFQIITSTRNPETIQIAPRISKTNPISSSNPPCIYG